MSANKHLKIGQLWYVRLDETASIHKVAVEAILEPCLVSLTFDSTGKSFLYKTEKVDWVEKYSEPKDTE